MPSHPEEGDGRRSVADTASMTSITERAESPTNIGSFAFWEQPFDEREKTFAHLRGSDPVSWQGPPDSLLVAPEDNTAGYWAITRFDHIREISRKPMIFSNAEGIFMEDLPEPVRVGALSFIVTDPPEHTQLRGIVTKAFTPRHVRTLEDKTREMVIDLVEAIRPNGSADICEEFTKQLPGRIFCSFFNITDPDLAHSAIEGAERIVSWNDPDYLSEGVEPIDVFGGAAMALQDVAFALADERRKTPGDDLMTWIIEAEHEGRRLEDWEIGSFFVLMAGAANDTTRHAMAHALRLFQEHPEQKALLLSDFDAHIDRAIEEVLRCCCIIMHMRRQVLEDYEIGGKLLRAGDKLALFYCSGNYDEDAFDDPLRFDITRRPNTLSFGGGGPHYCLGSVLAKQMLKHALREIYTRMPDIQVGEPEYLMSNFMHGIKRLPATWTP
jgi:cytochrome P450